MTDNLRTRLHHIMVHAWSTKRAEPARSFASCLKAAWAFSKRMARACKKLMRQAKAQGGRLQFHDLTRSPIRRSLTGQRGAKHTDFRAAYTTAVLGN